MTGKISKYLVDKVLDKAHVLTINALKSGQAIKVSGVGTLEVRNHKARNYSVPTVDANGTVVRDANGNAVMQSITAPAGKHVTFVISKGLYEDMNTLLP